MSKIAQLHNHSMTSLTMILRQRLRNEGIEDVQVEANSVDVHDGQLAAVFAMTFPPSLPDDRKTKIQQIARDECTNYIQNPKSLK